MYLSLFPYHLQSHCHSLPLVPTLSYLSLTQTSPYPLVDNTCLITLYISFRCTGAGAFIVLDSSLIGLQMSGLL